MTRVVVTAPADVDTSDILDYLERRGSLQTAAKYSASFERLYDRLAIHPESGAPRPRLGRDVRIGVVSPYIVYYRYDRTADLVAIVRVLHGGRNVTRQDLRHLH